MFNKVLTLLFRSTLVGFLGFAVGASLAEFDVNRPFPLVFASIVWILGGLYTLKKFEAPFKLSGITKVENIVSEYIKSNKQRKIAEEMLRVKQLRDSNILTEEEYVRKMNHLKEKYL